jgi:hypothetical protein
MRKACSVIAPHLSRQTGRGNFLILFAFPLFLGRTCQCSSLGADRGSRRKEKKFAAPTAGRSVFDLACFLAYQPSPKKMLMDALKGPSKIKKEQVRPPYRFEGRTSGSRGSLGSSAEVREALDGEEAV